MFENRQHYRLPFSERVLIGNPRLIQTARMVNISEGGFFVTLSQPELFRLGEHCSCVFPLGQSSQILKIETQIKRIQKSSFSEDKIPGLGLAFSQKDQKQIKNFIEEQRKNYELLSTLIQGAEPEWHSLVPLLQKLQMDNMDDLSDIKAQVERCLKSIESVNQSTL